jgi:hypothetical protein
MKGGGEGRVCTVEGVGGGGLESRRLEKGTGRMEDTLLVQRKYQDINQDERKGESPGEE